MPGLSGSQCFSEITLKLWLSSSPTAAAIVSSINFTRLLKSILTYRSSFLDFLISTCSKNKASVSSYGTLALNLLKVTPPLFWITRMASVLNFLAF